MTTVIEKESVSMFPLFETTKARLSILLGCLFMFGVTLGHWDYGLAIYQVIVLIPLSCWFVKKDFK